MKNIIIILLFFIKIANAQTEQMTVPLSDPNKPGSLEIGIVTGSIHVIGYAGKEVLVEANSAPSNKMKVVEKNGMKRINATDNFGLNIEESKNKIEIGVDQPNKRVNLIVKVPRKFDVRVSTINGGEIIVEGISGSIEASNINGAVKLLNIAGDASVNTVNGNIFADFDAVSAGTPMAFTTINGKIEMTMPSTTKANLKFQSEHGEMYSDFDMEAVKSAPSIKKIKEEGVYKIIKEGWTNMKINGGGAEFMLKSLHGDIFIKKGK
jgi:hypothetical protein